MRAKGVNQKQIKTTNQSLIINEIRSAGSLSRSELAKKLMLSAPSISANIDDLISRNVILEKGAGESARGRKPINLVFNYSYGYVAAVDMVSSSSRIALSDLSGTNVLDYAHVEDTWQITPEAADRIMDTISQLLRKHDIPEEKLLCICLGSPGIIDPDTSAIVFAPRIIDLPGTALRDRFASRFNADVIVKNDLNCSAVGEQLFGAGVDYRNFINIQLDLGSGAGLILNNQLYEGSRGSAGEVGLWIMDYKPVVEGQGVSLVNVADYHISVFGLLCKVKEQYPDVLAPMGEGDIDLHQIAGYAKLMFAAARAGDERVLAIIREGVAKLGCVLRNICLLLDLEAVIIGGLMLELDELYLEPLEEIMSAHISTQVRIVPSTLGDKAVLFGAIGEAINKILDNIINNGD